MEIKQYNGLYFDGNEFVDKTDSIATEVALTISVNDVPFTVTMQTPGVEEDLARGLLFTEHIFRDSDVKPNFEIISRNEEGHIDALNVIIPGELVLKDFAGSRNVISASSCGICGKTSLDEENVTVINIEKLNPDHVPEMFDQMNSQQKQFQQAGGTHAAAAFNIDGKILVSKEDIGRHNAVDKVIGFLINNDLLNQAKCIIVSGRVSYEIVEKSRSANIPFLAAVSAPSSLAIDNAEKSGITLIAFCRQNRFTIYSNPRQVKLNKDQQAISHIKTNRDVI